MLKKILTKFGIHFWKEEYYILSIEELEEDEKKYLNGIGGLSVKYTQFNHSNHLTKTHNCFLHNHLEYISSNPMYRKIKICKVCGEVREYKESDRLNINHFSGTFSDYWGKVSPTKSQERNRKIEEILT